MTRANKKYDKSKKKQQSKPYIILFMLFGGFSLLIGYAVYSAISVPIEQGPTVTGTVIGIDVGRTKRVTGIDMGWKGIIVKLDEGQVVCVGGKQRIPYLKGRRIQLQELTCGNRKGYRFIGYLEPEPVRGVPPVSSFHQERP